MDFSDLLRKDFIKLCKDIPVDDPNMSQKWFKSWDNNGNKLLSLTEIDKGIRDELKLGELYKCKKVITAAFKRTVKNKLEKENKDKLKSLVREDSEEKAIKIRQKEMEALIKKNEEYDNKVDFDLTFRSKIVDKDK